MASVPNMRLTVATPMPDGAGPTEGEGSDLFARILSLAPVVRSGVEGEISAELGEATANRDPDSDEHAAEPALAPAIPDLLPVLAAQNAAPVAVNAPSPADTEIPPVETPSLAEVEISRVGRPLSAGVGISPVETPPQRLETIPNASVPAADAAASHAAPRDTPPIKPSLKAHAKPGAAVKPAVAEFVSTGRLAATAEDVDARQGPPADAPDGKPDPLGRVVKAAVAAAIAGRRGVASPVAQEVHAGRIGGDAPASPPPPAAALATAPIVTSGTPAPFVSAAPGPESQAQTEPLIDLAVDLARESEWLDRIARDIARLSDGEGAVRFRLHPQSLGHLRVELSQTDSGTAIRLTAETEAARAILADAQPRLLAEARAQGLKISETHVDLAGSDEGAADDPRRQDEARQPLPLRTARGRARPASAGGEPAATRSERYA